MALHGVVNLWGFAVFRDGRVVRRKAGTFEDFGAPCAEEEKPLARSTLDADGERVYRLPEFPDEEFNEDQVGEEFVFKIFERLAGERRDAGETLLETRCAGFRFASIASAAPIRPWWKFWR